MFTFSTENMPLLNQVRLRLTQMLLLFVIFGNLAFLIAETQAEQTSSTLQLSLALAASTIMFVVLSLGYMRSPIINLTVIYLALLSFSVPTGDDVTLVMVLTLALIAAALTASSLGFWVTVLLVSLRIGGHLVIYGNSLQALGTPPDQIALDLTGTAVLGGLPLLIGALIRYFTLTLRRTAEDARSTANLLGASASIGQIIANMLELDDLLNETVDIIRDRFAFYHVQIFLVDEQGRYAHLTASTGEVGQAMLARQHRLPIDSNSVVGRTVQAAEPIISQDTGSDGIHAYNELLPHTRSELGLPILIGNEVIGALDVQSTRRNAFATGQIQALQVISSQLASAIRNARLFEQQTRNSNENKRLFIEAETRLREIQRLNQRLTQQAWTDYLVAQHRVSGITLDNMAFRNKAEWSDPMLEARQRRRPIIRKDAETQVVAVPIQLRGEVIGALEVETPLNQHDTVDILQAIGQRLGTSVENARLFEEAQAASAQENRISEIVSEFPSAQSVDDLLKITIEGLVETLGAEKGEIRLGVSGINQTKSLPKHQQNGTQPDRGVTHD